MGVGVPGNRQELCDTGNVWTDDAGIIGIGYEGQDIRSFIDGLVKWDVDVLVDVRLNPVSRKRGFSKTALREALEGAGIRYSHLPALGNPRDNRDGYAESDSPRGTEARDTYQRILDADDAQAALDTLVDEANVGHVVVMCFERSELHCHRKQVLEVVRLRVAGLVRT